jgi:hypothetical protein
VVAVTQSQVSPTVLPEGEEASIEEPTRPSDGPHGPTAGPPTQEAPTRPSGWTAGRIAALVVGVLLVLLSLPVLGGGATALWADRTQREAGYATTDVHEFSSSGSALATVSTELGSAGVGWLYAPGLLDKVRIRVTPNGSDGPVFVGIAPSTDVDHYLARVNHTIITEFFGDKTEAVEGSTPVAPPGAQDFWVASASGSGPQTLLWEPTDGSWTVVVMNADGRPGIDIGADLGAKVPSLLWIALGFLVAGALLLAGGVLLVVGVFRRNRTA